MTPAVLRVKTLLNLECKTANVHCWLGLSINNVPTNQTQHFVTFTKSVLHYTDVETYKNRTHAYQSLIMFLCLWISFLFGFLWEQSLKPEIYLCTAIHRFFENDLVLIYTGIGVHILGVSAIFCSVILCLSTSSITI